MHFFIILMYLFKNEVFYMFLNKKAKQVLRPHVVTTVVEPKKVEMVKPIVEVKKPTTRKNSKVEDIIANE